MMLKSIEMLPSDYTVLPRDGAELSEWTAVLKEEEEESAGLWRPALFALSVLVLGVGSFITWATFTDLVQASTASAKVIVESNTKTVTHAEGGTLQALAVKEGQKVQTGDVLATLDDTRARSTLVQIKQQIFSLDIRVARLIAERDESDNFEPNAPVPSDIDPKSAKEWVATEKKLFVERKKQFTTTLANDKLLIEQLESEKASLTARRQSWVEQAAVLQSDYDAQIKLRKRQLTTKTQLNAVKLQYIDMMTRISESDASIASNKKRAAQAELAVVNSRNEYFRQISEQIQSVEAERARAKQDLVAAEHIVNQSTIRSPQEGIIANIRIRTPGSALPPGQPLLDIVPANQALVLEGKARSIDIDTLRVGERVEVRLNAFSMSDDLPLEGTVTYVAPDSTVNEHTGDATFTFRAQIDSAELKKRPGMFLYPGMTATVNIVNGSRTALAYLIEPISKSFSQAFHER